MQTDQFPFQGYDWDKREILGEGGFGKVFKVKNIKQGQYVAIKQMSMAKFDQEYKLNALKNQIKVMMETASPHTVQLYEYHIGKIYTYIVLELCNGDLKKLLLENGDKLPEDASIDIFLQVLEGFRVLLEKGYIHRDVKPENVLIKNHICKLADYGFTRKINDDKEVINEVCGTPIYMAPQLLYSKPYTAKCDIWSLGIMFYQMLYGFQPWPCRHMEVYKHSIVSKGVAFPYGSKIGANTRDFIEKCLKLEEEDRLTWKDLFAHPLIAKKDRGPPIKQIEVPKHVEKILIRVQESSSRKLINVKDLFVKYQKYLKIDQKQFNQFLLELDPQITTYESHEIFKAADLSQDGYVNLNQFHELFLQVDYRPVEDIGSRRIQQIVGMAQARNLNIRQFFDLFDKDKSSEIDREQFYAFIRYIAPKIRNNEIEEMWKRFDEDNSGTITMNQFVNELTRGVPNQGSKLVQNRERAKRNVECLQSFLQRKKLTAQEVFGKAHVKGQAMTLQQFGPMVQSINYVITKDEVIDMFSYLDQNNSGSIEINELKVLLGY